MQLLRKKNASQVPNINKFTKSMCVYMYINFPPAILAGGRMTTLKGDDIDYSSKPLNEAGLMASVNVDHGALLQKLPSWDHDKH